VRDRSFLNDQGAIEEEGQMIPLMNAAGWYKLPADAERLLKVPGDLLPAITLGGYVYALEERLGNASQGNTFWDDGASRPTGLNSLGLPGPKWLDITNFMPSLIDRARAVNKRVRVNVSEFTAEQFALSARMFANLGVDEIEINLGCPNTQTPVASFNPELVGDIIERVYNVTFDFPRLKRAVKLSPYSDPGVLAKIAEVITERKAKVDKVVTCNTFPNASGYDEGGKLVIDANNGFAGLSGSPLKHIMLGQVRQLRARLPESIGIIAVGAISEGRDVRDAEYAGASEAQVGTACFLQGERIFQHIAEGY
jgi:dihydroorotate dehydrogenase